ncbi:hypothetical protein H6P81_009022 [Aristolochia fimbriata]|uniref:Uncharacterized protein n=1 Tax=Aristolochia fimbriata TaxID=158543 RepID=A0AAV7EMV1_ARIFI|nr:hypothetical protein H6P81_009022 [Aristolochia fimbriata]
MSDKYFNTKTYIKKLTAEPRRRKDTLPSESDAFRLDSIFIIVNAVASRFVQSRWVGEGVGGGERARMGGGVGGKNMSQALQNEWRVRWVDGVEVRHFLGLAGPARENPFRDNELEKRVNRKGGSVGVHHRGLLPGVLGGTHGTHTSRGHVFKNQKCRAWVLILRWLTRNRRFNSFCQPELHSTGPPATRESSPPRAAGDSTFAFYLNPLPPSSSSLTLVLLLAHPGPPPRSPWSSSSLTLVLLLARPLLQQKRKTRNATSSASASSETRFPTRTLEHGELPFMRPEHDGRPPLEGREGGDTRRRPPPIRLPNQRRGAHVRDAQPFRRQFQVAQDRAQVLPLIGRREPRDRQRLRHVPDEESQLARHRRRHGSFVDHRKFGRPAIIHREGQGVARERGGDAHGRDAAWVFPVADDAERLVVEIEFG